MVTTTVAIDYDRVPRIGAPSCAHDQDEEAANWSQPGNNDHIHFYPKGDSTYSRSISPPSAKTTNTRHRHCRHRPFEDHESSQTASSSQVPFSPRTSGQPRRTTTSDGASLPTLLPFTSSRTRHWWTIMFYTLLSLLVLMSNHLVDSILVRNGSENNRTPPAPVKGKS